MTEAVSVQEQLQAAMEAEAKGIPVDLKSLCVQTYNAAMGEIKRLQDELEGTAESTEE